MLKKLTVLAGNKGMLGWAVLLLAFLVWWQLPGTYADPLLPFAWMIVTQLVFAGSFEAARLRRQAWLGQYLKKSSTWSRLLRGGAMMVVWHQLASAVLAVVLLVSLRLASLLEMAMLLVGAGLCLGCVRWARKRLASHIIPGYLSAVTRRLLVAPMSALIGSGLIAVSLTHHQPYLVGMQFGIALQEHIVPSSQSLLGAFERGANALELSSFWLMQNALNDLGVGGLVAVLGWVGVFAIQGVLALAFVRLLVGVAAAHDALLHLGERSAVDAKQAENTAHAESER